MALPLLGLGMLALRGIAAVSRVARVLPAAGRVMGGVGRAAIRVTGSALRGGVVVARTMGRGVATTARVIGRTASVIRKTGVAAGSFILGGSSNQSRGGQRDRVDRRSVEDSANDGQYSQSQSQRNNSSPGLETTVPLVIDENEPVNTSQNRLSEIRRKKRDVIFSMIKRVVAGGGDGFEGTSAGRPSGRFSLTPFLDELRRLRESENSEKAIAANEIANNRADKVAWRTKVGNFMKFIMKNMSDRLKSIPGNALKGADQASKVGLLLLAGGLITKFVMNAWEKLDEMLTSVTRSLSETWSGISDKFTEMKDNIIGKFTATMTGISEWWDDLSIKDMAEGVWGTTKEFFGTVTSSITAMIGKWSSIVDWIKDSWLGKLFTKLSDSIGEFSTNFKGFIQDWADTIFGGTLKDAERGEEAIDENGDRVRPSEAQVRETPTIGLTRPENNPNQPPVNYGSDFVGVDDEVWSEPIDPSQFPPESEKDRMAEKKAEALRTAESVRSPDESPVFNNLIGHAVLQHYQDKLIEFEGKLLNEEDPATVKKLEVTIDELKRRIRVLNSERGEPLAHSIPPSVNFVPDDSYTANQPMFASTDVDSMNASVPRGKRFSQSVEEAILAAHQQTGVSEDFLRSMAVIESEGRADAVSPTGATGLFQFTEGTGKAYGLVGPGYDDRKNAKANAIAAAKLAQDNKKSLQRLFKRFGIDREVTDFDLYMAHQQGAGGWTHILRKAESGEAVSPAIRENMNNNDGKGLSASQFVKSWESKFNEKVTSSGFSISGGNIGSGSLSSDDARVNEISGAISVNPDDVITNDLKGKIRNKPITDALKRNVAEAVVAVYGEGSRATLYSGGQAEIGSGENRVGSTRHDLGRAGDFRIYGPDGKQIRGDSLGKLAQYWLAANKGGVGLEMSGGGIHLDEHLDRTRFWNYVKDGGSFTSGQKSAVTLE